MPQYWRLKWWWLAGVGAACGYGVSSFSCTCYHLEQKVQLHAVTLCYIDISKCKSNAKDHYQILPLPQPLCLLAVCVYIPLTPSRSRLLDARQAVCYKMKRAFLQYIPILMVQRIFHPKVCRYNKDDTLTCSKVHTLVQCLLWTQVTLHYCNSQHHFAMHTSSHSLCCIHTKL